MFAIEVDLIRETDDPDYYRVVAFGHAFWVSEVTVLSDNLIRAKADNIVNGFIKSGTFYFFECEKEIIKYVKD